jgi:siroheme synthase-like protein
MAGYPITLQLKDRRVLIVGGGKVAARKARALIAASAKLSILSPSLDDSLRGQAFTWLQSEYYQDAIRVEKPILVFAATDDEALNKQIAQDAQSQNVLVNLANDAEASDFHNMALIEKSPFTIGISSNANSPALLMLVKERLAAAITDGLVTFGTWLGSLRSAARVSISSQEDRQRLYTRVVASDVLALLEAGKNEEAKFLFDKLVEEAL